MRIRAATHVHSEWSYDGSWTLDRLGEAFTRRGYDCILMAEHDRGFDQAKLDDYRAACAHATTERILIVPGIEYSDPDNTVHLPTWGAAEFLGEDQPTDHTLDAAAEHGAAVLLAHPTRKNAIDRFEPGWVERLMGVEIWNRKTHGFRPSRDGAGLLKAHPTLAAFASLDFHRSRQFFPLATELELDPGQPTTEESVVTAMRRGRVRPVAFGVEALRFVSGPMSLLATAGEGARRAGVRIRGLTLGR